MMITGGSEAPIVESTVGGFNASRAMSTQNEDFEHASKPFDVRRDGFVLGEGAGALVIEELEHAKRRGATILAEIVGGGMASDAYHLTGTHPQGDGAKLGISLALEEAGIGPEEVDYLNAHATSTPQGDLSELRGIEQVFGRRKDLHISATKSMTGHLLGAAGAIEAIACVGAIVESFIPPTINTADVEEEFKDAYDFTLGKVQQKEVKYALSNTFGFGGHIASSLFKKYED